LKRLIRWKIPKRILATAAQEVTLGDLDKNEMLRPRSDRGDAER